LKLSVGKISNYTGILDKEEDEKMMTEQLNDHLVNVDRDIQNLWRVCNANLKLIGSQGAVLASNAELGFTYIPLISPNPFTTPTAYFAHTAIAFCNSNSNLYIYNTSDNAWKTVHLT
jgi:hypothetical protein